jgi:hypothetical protein
VKAVANRDNVDADGSNAKQQIALPEANTRRPLLIAAAIGVVIVVIYVVVRINEIPLGALEHRSQFHEKQLDFQDRVRANQVIGRAVEDVFDHVAGRPAVFSYGSDWECDWKYWPCELVVRGGIVRGVFYHDYPYTTQPLPEDYAATHSRPYFERHSGHLTSQYGWDNSTFRFHKSNE